MKAKRRTKKKVTFTSLKRRIVKHQRAIVVTLSGICLSILAALILIPVEKPTPSISTVVTTPAQYVAETTKEVVNETRAALGFEPQKNSSRFNQAKTFNKVKAKSQMKSAAKLTKKTKKIAKKGKKGRPVAQNAKKKHFAGAR